MQDFYHQPYFTFRISLPNLGGCALGFGHDLQCGLKEPECGRFGGLQDDVSDHLDKKQTSVYIYILYI